MNYDIALIGLGRIGIEYSKVLSNLGLEVLALGRSQLTCINFTKVTGIKSFPNYLHYLNNHNGDLPKRAIISVSEMSLTEVLIDLLNFGFNEILIEKPGFSFHHDLDLICNLVKMKGADVRIAYNRRFYASILESERIIEKDNGITSFNFEFTELSNRVNESIQNIDLKNNWFWHNSTHVIDLAFYFGGLPKDISSFVKDGLSWHRNSIFVGAGLTVCNIPFSYLSNWDAPGRWGLEIQTRKTRIILRPLEMISIQKLNSFTIDKHIFNNSFDINFKPGFYLQVKNFIENKEKLLDIYNQKINCEIYKRINK